VRLAKNEATIIPGMKCHGTISPGLYEISLAHSVVAARSLSSLAGSKEKTGAMLSRAVFERAEFLVAFFPVRDQEN